MASRGKLSTYREWLGIYDPTLIVSKTRVGYINFSSVCPCLHLVAWHDDILLPIVKHFNGASIFCIVPLI